MKNSSHRALGLACLVAVAAVSCGQTAFRAGERAQTRHEDAPAGANKNPPITGGNVNPNIPNPGGPNNIPTLPRDNSDPFRQGKRTPGGTLDPLPGIDVNGGIDSGSRNDSSRDRNDNSEVVGNRDNDRDSNNSGIDGNGNDSDEGSTKLSQKFRNTCGPCHGLNGQGTPGAAPAPPGSRSQSFEDFSRIDYNGLGAMPAFTEGDFSRADLRKDFRALQKLR